MSFTVTYASSADEKRFFRIADDFYGIVDGFLVRSAACKLMDSLLEEGNRIVIGLTLDILRHCNAHCTGIRWIGESPEGTDHGTHQLLRTHDAVPVAADGPECIIRGDRQVMGLLDLLQHGIRLSAGIDITRQNQDRDVVCSCRSSGGDHVGRTRAYGSRDCNDLLALHLLGKSDCSVGHALLVLSLPDLQAAGFLGKGLSEAEHVAVTRKHYHTLYEGMLLAVI